MSVELINCAVCGHVVATDARCCPHCGTTSYNAKKIELDAQNRKEMIERRQLERDRIKNKIKQHGKLFTGGIQLQSFPYGQSKDSVYWLFIDGNRVIGSRRDLFDLEEYRKNYVILSYGVHTLSVCLVPESKTRVVVKREGWLSVKETWRDAEYNDVRMYELHTHKFDLKPNGNDVVDATATYKSSQTWHTGWTGERRVDFLGFSINEKKFDFSNASDEEIQFLNNLLSKYPD